MRPDPSSSVPGRPTRTGPLDPRPPTDGSTAGNPVFPTDRSATTAGSGTVSSDRSIKRKHIILNRNENGTNRRKTVTTDRGSDSNMFVLCNIVNILAKKLDKMKQITKFCHTQHTESLWRTADHPNIQKLISTYKRGRSVENDRPGRLVGRGRLRGPSRRSAPGNCPHAPRRLARRVFYIRGIVSSTTVCPTTATTAADHPARWPD